MNDFTGCKQINLTIDVTSSGGFFKIYLKYFRKGSMKLVYISQGFYEISIYF